MKFKISYVDRVGLVHDVSKVIYDLGINIISLQVYLNVMYCEIEIWGEFNFENLYNELLSIPHIIAVEKTKFMPYEVKERQLKVVLDSIAEGVLATDHNGKIEIVNLPAQRILKKSTGDLLGKPIQEILNDNILLETLKTGIPHYNNTEINIKTDNRKMHFLISDVPIKDKNNDIIGAVATLRDMSEVKELYFKLTQPKMWVFDDIIGVSSELKRIVDVAKNVAKSDSTIILRGESGTGKELFARSIHMESSRKNKPFVPVNCAALPETLLESELFGYTEGAFTGSKRGGKPGLFEFAGDGTLFLDEIGEITSHLQAKLLRVLQEGTIRRVGANEETRVNCRIISATNKNLEEMVSNGLFREDLYYRINVIPIYIPPLRERREDIPILANFFLKKAAMRARKEIDGISEKAMEKLVSHEWPGNIRELENVLERAVNLNNGSVINPDEIILDIAAKKGQKAYEDLSQKNLGLRDIVADVEREVLVNVLIQYPSSRKAAEILKVSHTTILNKMKKYGLTVER